MGSSPASDILRYVHGLGSVEIMCSGRCKREEIIPLEGAGLHVHIECGDRGNGNGGYGGR